MLSVSQVFLEHRLNNINVSMYAGECWHVLGQNGAGKSSLFDVIAGLVKPDSGAVTLNGKNMSAFPISELATQLAYLQQHYALTFSLNVSEILTFYAGHTDIPHDIEKALSITPLLKYKLNNLSGGEQQRVHIARCLMQIWHHIKNGEALILLDEPIQSLDVVFQEQTLAMLRGLAQKGNLVVLSIHDVNLSLRYCDHVLMIKNQTDFCIGDVKTVMTAENISELYNYPFAEVINQHGAEKFFIRSPL
jgi:vitamin B12 transport system ATP-binding protein